jgi:FkbM family methyltransferase
MTHAECNDRAVSEVPMIEQLALLHDAQLRASVARHRQSLGGRRESAAHLDELFHALIDLVRPEVFLEVGAADAEASLAVAARHPQCRVVALEATDYIHARASASTDYPAAGVDYRYCAASDHDGTVTFRLDVDPVSGELLPGQSLLARSDAGALREVEVPSARLDSVIPDRNVNVGAWIDVEGAIREVLAGASGLLPQVAVLKVEVEDAQIWEGQLISLDVIEHLLAAGLVPVARDAEYVGQYNVLFVSGRWARHAAVRQALEEHAYRLEHEWSREPSRVRQSETLRGVLRPVRRGVSQIVGRARRG